MREEDDEIDQLLEAEYRRFCQARTNAAGTIKKREPLKENTQAANAPITSPAELSFGRAKELGRAQESLSRLLEFMGCRCYSEAVVKAGQMRKNEKFIQKVLEMTEMCEPGEEASLHTSWKIIKEAVSAKYAHQLS